MQNRNQLVIMNERYSKVTLALITATLVGLFLPASSSAYEAQKTNIIFVLTDDLGWGDLGVFFQNQREEDRRFATPKLDQFALEGIQMRNHYVPAPVCAPTRASLLTGRHQGHEEVRNNQFDKALPPTHNLATVLKQAGYQTVMIGKYGLPGGNRAKYNMDEWDAYPTRRGFDEFFGAVKHRDAHSHYPANLYPRGDNKLHRGTFPWYHNDKQLTTELDGAYTTDLVTAFAKKWLVEHVGNNPSQPFFIFLSHTTPHAALHVPSMPYPMGGGLKGGVQWIGEPGNMINTVGGDFDEWFHPEYADKNWAEQEKRFATMVRRIDDSMGDLIQTLKDLGIDKDTVVVFTSDNGPHRESYLVDLNYNPTSFASYGPFTGIKRDVLEGGIRVPTLARWPGTIPAGQINEVTSQLHDWLPTLAQVAGVPAPALSDGVSLLPHLTGVGKAEESTVYVEYFNPEPTPDYAEFPAIHRGRERGEMQAIFMEGYKGIRRNIKSHADDFMIFDVNNDPQELNDLAQNPDFGAGLQQRLKDRVLQIRRPNASAPRPYDNAPVPAISASYDPEVNWALYTSDFPWVPQTSGLKVAKTGTRASVDLEGIGASFGDVVEFQGHINADVTGNYVFVVETSGGAIFRIHDAVVIDQETQTEGKSATEGSILLEKGVHPFTLTMLVGEDPQLKFAYSM